MILRLLAFAFVYLACTSSILLAQRTTLAPSDRVDLRHGPRPSILLIVADDMSWRDIDSSIPTPNIDGLAHEGVSFRRAYAQPLCSPARYSILFGMQPFREGLGFWINTFDEADVSVPLGRIALPQVLRTLSYQTIATGKWHLSTRILGFPALYEMPRLHGFHTYRAGSVGNITDYHDWERVDDGALTISNEYASTATARAAAEWWQATEGPRFAYVAFQAAHAPFHDAPGELLPAGYTIAPDTRGQFESMIVALDTEIGNLLSVVDFNSTLVIFLADNGTPLPAAAPDQDLTKVKGTVYEGGINVPFIVAGWGVPRNRTCDALISSTDIYATILDVLGEPDLAAPALDSVSFAPQLQDPRLPGRFWVYAQKFAPNGPGPYDCNTKAVITSRYKLLQEDSRQFLFDLNADPREENPLTFLHEDRLIYGTLRRFMERMEARGAP